MISRSVARSGEESVIIAKKNRVVNLANIKVVFMRYFKDIDFEGDIAFVNKFMREHWQSTFEIIKEITSKAKWISNFDTSKGYSITKHYSLLSLNLLEYLMFLRR